MPTTITNTFLGACAIGRWTSGHVLIGGQHRYLGVTGGAWDFVSSPTSITLPEAVFDVLDGPGVSATSTGLLQVASGALYELTTETDPSGAIVAKLEPTDPPDPG